MEEKKVTTYEEELKALKAKWADKRKEEKQAKRNEAKLEARKENVDVCYQCLELLSKLNDSGKKELEPAIKRIEMYIKNERYTRDFKGRTKNE